MSAFGARGARLDPTTALGWLLALALGLCAYWVVATVRESPEALLCTLNEKRYSPGAVVKTAEGEIRCVDGMWRR